jgi:hypothetical protein
MKKDFELIPFAEFFMYIPHYVLSENMDVETIKTHVHA